MKRTLIRKLISMLLCCILCITALVGCVPIIMPPVDNPDDTPDTQEHVCSEQCPDCGGCLDEDCNNAACLPKCDCDDPGDNPGDKPGSDQHVCSKPCPQCGGCLDESCNDAACLPKCERNHDTDTPNDERYSYRPVISDQMPAVYINTTNGSNDFVTVPDRDAKLRDEIQYVSATVSVEDDDGELVIDEATANVKARGNYTLDYEKKPIRIKFDKKQNVLGLNGGAKFKNWVLLADWKDLSMSNNTTAFYLGKTILGSDGYYSSDYRNVEVYLNGEYWGVYLLVEQQEAKGDDGRTSAPQVPDDYTGVDVGYFVEYDGYYTDERNMPNDSGDPTFELTYNNFSVLRKLNGSHLYTEWAQRGYTVKSDIYDDAQLYFIQTFMDNAFRIAYEAVYNGNYYAFNSDYSELISASGSAQAIVSAVIDVQSLVDMYILSEIACDPDIAWSSFYISLDMTETGSHKLIFEAPWDFDSAFGIKQGFVNSGLGMYAANCDNPWLILLINEQWFQDMVRAKWAELVENDVLSTALALVKYQKSVYQQYYADNFTRWENRIIYGNGELIWELNTYTTQAQAADYLYNWLNKRFNYLSTVWGGDYDVPDVPSKPDEGSTRYRFEAEYFYYDYPIKRDTWHSELASNGEFLGQIDGTYGARITLNVYVEQDVTVFLAVGLSKRSFDAVFSDWFAVSVNDAELNLPSRIIPACSGDDIEWVAWTDVYLMPIELHAGHNDITFTTVSGTATNVDYFDLYSTIPIYQA